MSISLSRWARTVTDCHGPLWLVDPHAVLVAVDLQARRLVERPDAQPLHQVRLLEGVLPTRNTSRSSHSMPGHGVQEPALALVRRRRSRRRVRWFQLVSLKSPSSWIRSSSQSRMAPSQRQGLPSLVTRSTVCQRRPSVSHGMAASLPTASSSTSPVPRCLGRVAGRNRGRSTCGPAASTGARAAAGVRAPAPWRPRLPACPAATMRPPAGAGFGAEVDDPVGRLDHVQVVLDDDHRVAQVHQAVSTSSSLWMSSKCRPVVGSSRM